MDLIYVAFTLYIVLKTLSFSLYEIKGGNISSFAISMIINIIVVIITFIYYI